MRREFSDDQCTDLAAALTYYGVLAIFPAVLALSAILGLVGQAEKSVQTVLDVISPLVSEDALGTIEPTLLELASSKSAGWALLFGAAARAVVGVRLRRRVRPRHEQDLRDR